MFTSYHVSVGMMGRYIQMRLAAPSDRPLQTFPRGAFENLPPTDPPFSVCLEACMAPVGSRGSGTIRSGAAFCIR